MNQSKQIRNFTIIAHIDHGKSTLADRMLEMTHTIEARKMKDQVLDSMDLERERGITIKMQPVRMKYSRNGVDFMLHLIDTPGHIDFSYEVSRALTAVEGSVLLVDATQGVQAQTLTTLAMARTLGHVIIPAVSKIDSPYADIPRVKKEVAELLGVEEDTIMEVSGKTGQGVEELIQAIVARIPSPFERKEAKEVVTDHQGFPQEDRPRALIFDFQYSDHRGVIVYVRVFGGEFKKGDECRFSVSNARFKSTETGTFAPQETPVDSLSNGMIGYIVTGIKEPGIASVGDTIFLDKKPVQALPGYQSALPVVWASLYPESQDDFPLLRQALERLQLSDSALSFEEESSGALGRGFRCGFLGMLHLEIITERLKREFSLSLIVTTPSITYEVTMKNGKTEKVYSPIFFPEDSLITSVREPWVNIKLITPPEYVGSLVQVLYEHEAEVGNTDLFGTERTAIEAKLPLREMMRNFFDEIKSLTSGYASISYEMGEMRSADVVRMDILVADEPVVAFARVVSRKRLELEARKAVEKLQSVLPRQMFAMKIQAKAQGRIIASESVSAMRKDVTGYLYGGDITRKMKLLEKQKKGKKKMKERGTVNIPQDVFIKMVKGGD
ncbi:MAG TPA: translation elongation factor 4 [Candidatus Paceibacterota bacterium]|nr:translation elongation factor 4 [Candidatus Paceibacterota bacterium]